MCESEKKRIYSSKETCVRVKKDIKFCSKLSVQVNHHSKDLKEYFSNMVLGEFPCGKFTLVKLTRGKFPLINPPPLPW